MTRATCLLLLAAWICAVVHGTTHQQHLRAELGGNCKDADNVEIVEKILKFEEHLVASGKTSQDANELLDDSNDKGLRKIFTGLKMDQTKGYQVPNTNFAKTVNTEAQKLFEYLKGKKCCVLDVAGNNNMPQEYDLSNSCTAVSMKATRRAGNKLCGNLQKDTTLYQRRECAYQVYLLKMALKNNQATAIAQKESAVKKCMATFNMDACLNDSAPAAQFQLGKCPEPKDVCAKTGKGAKKDVTPEWKAAVTSAAVRIK